MLLNLRTRPTVVDTGPVRAAIRPAFSAHLDAIRGVAALVVFLAHGRNMFFGNVGALARSNAFAAAPSGDQEAAGIGHHAVIVFFVLSGYLVGGGVLKGMKTGRWSWPVYLRQRLARLWVVLLPALAIGLMLDLAGIRGAGPGSLYQAPVGQSVVIHPVAQGLNLATLLGNIVFLQRIKVGDFGSNGALWSVANEFWYYIAFPLLVILVRTVSLSTRALCILALSLICWLTGFPVVLYFSIWLLGVAVSVITPSLGRSAAGVLTITSLLLFGCASIWLRTHPTPLYLADLILGVVASALIYGCLHYRKTAWPAYSKLAGALAGMSYTLYVMHLPALTFMSSVIVDPWRPWPKHAVNIAEFAGVILAVFLYATVVYFAFERHTDRIRKALSPKPATMAA